MKPGSSISPTTGGLCSLRAPRGRVWKPLTGRLSRFDQTLGGGFTSSLDTYPVAISGDGRFVMFESRSSNLVRHDTNRTWDVFVRNLVAHHTRRISIGTGGRQANQSSAGLGISGDGRYRLFETRGSNLVAGDTNGKRDIFVRTTASTRPSAAASPPPARKETADHPVEPSPKTRSTSPSSPALPTWRRPTPTPRSTSSNAAQAADPSTRARQHAAVTTMSPTRRTRERGPGCGQGTQLRPAAPRTHPFSRASAAAVGRCAGTGE
jgi:hypothetical protein